MVARTAKHHWHDCGVQHEAPPRNGKRHWTPYSEGKVDIIAVQYRHYRRRIPTPGEDGM